MVNINTWGFTMRGQEYKFGTREDYLKAFSRALEIDKEQQAIIEEKVEVVEQEPEVAIELELETEAK